MIEATYDWLRLHIPAWVWITLVMHIMVLLTVAYLILLWSWHMTTRR